MAARAPALSRAAPVAAAAVVAMAAAYGQAPAAGASAVRAEAGVDAGTATPERRALTKAEAAAAAAPLPTDKLRCERRGGAGGGKGSAWQWPFGEAAARRRRPPRQVVLLACGSFNPPTAAHLRMMEAARDAVEGGPDAAVVVGAYLSPVNDGYRKEALAPAAHRVAMCRAAAADSPLLMVDAWEAEQPAYVRTLAVLRRVREALRLRNAGDDVRVVLVCGADLLSSFGRPGVWIPEHLHEILGEDHGVVCVTRGDEGVANAAARSLRERGLGTKPGALLVVNDWARSDVSSTEVRAALGNGRSARYAVPAAVLEYVCDRGLYDVDQQACALKYRRLTESV